MSPSQLFRNVATLFACYSIPIACAIAVTFGPPVVPVSTPVNAMWSYDNAVFIMWIYGEKSTCPETRRNANSVLMIAPGHPPADKEWKYMIPAEIPICLLNARDKETAICESGELSFEYFETDKEYRGEYKFDLSDGTKEAGVFRAKYCPMGN